MSTRTRLTSAQEASLIALDKNIRATHYPDSKDQRSFLDRQAGIVVCLYEYFNRSRTLKIFIYSIARLPPAVMDVRQQA
jgi:hypothetical protein